MLRRIAIKFLMPFVFLSTVTLFTHAENEVPAVAEMTDTGHATAGEVFEPGKMILEHISDSHEWHFFSFKRNDGTEFHGSICLPVIIYTPGEGLSMFSFHQLHHPSVYKGYSINEEGKIFRPDNKPFYDLSITKNVCQMLIAVTLMLLIFISAARNYKRFGVGKAPRGLASVVEVLVIFVRDEIARPMLGKRANTFLPYLLTVFFFIWINNLMGLLPGAANVTGNIAVTGTLAVITFILMMVGSRKPYWAHMVAPPGVPPAVLVILIPIEFISNVIVKPVALMIRLFANMLGGHLIVLSFMAIIFIFGIKSLVTGVGVSVFSVSFSIFIYLLELLVAALQAYIFTILSALFIGETGNVEEHAEGHH